MIAADPRPRSGSGFAPVAPSSGVLTALSGREVTITGGFWANRQAVNADATLRHCLSWMERLGWTANFDRVARGEDGPSSGREFADSEVYKLLEALAWEAGRSGPGWAEQTFRALSGRVVAAQQPDGYLNTWFGGPGRAPRYSDLEWGHELYCAGHLIQAAVARARTVPGDALDDPLVTAAVRVADHICEEFSPSGRNAVCGHPEIEVALAELSRVTGRARYLEQAALFIERRGAGLLDAGDASAEYFQDDIPVRDAHVLRGHAVRALYLAAGAVDVAIENGDADLLNAVRTQWTNTVATRTYLTGGMGSRHEGESFGDDFELPSDRAYSETCAGVASVMVGWRLLLAGGETKYADLIERTLFNVVATSPDERGTSFFYVNPLQRNSPGNEAEAEADRPSARAASSQRAPWFDVSCCPTNVARTMASLGSYIATKDDAGVQIHQYADARIDTALSDGERVILTVGTGYPFSGDVTVRIETAARRAWTLSLRIPPWARGTATFDDGSGEQLVAGDTAKITGQFAAGTVIRLALPMQTRFTYPDRRVDSLRDSVAVERGPLVLCVESTDLPDGVHLSDVAVDTVGGFAEGEPGQASAAFRVRDVPSSQWPYESRPSAEVGESVRVQLTPYFRWAERGSSEMRVWLPIAHSDR